MQYCKTTRVNHSDVRIRRPPTPGRKTIIISRGDNNSSLFNHQPSGHYAHCSLRNWWFKSIWHSSKKSRCERLSYMQLNRLRRQAKTLSVPASSSSSPSSSPSLVIISFFLANTNIEKFRSAAYIFFPWEITTHRDASRCEEKSGHDTCDFFHL